MSRSSTRIAVAALGGMILGVVVSLINGRDSVAALIGGVQFSILLALIVAIIDWAVGISTRKGYGPWLGVVLVVFLNVLGAVILLILTDHNPDCDREE